VEYNGVDKRRSDEGALPSYLMCVPSMGSYPAR